MAARARIGLKTDKDTIVSIYCHHDGHPEYLGKVLVQNYNTVEKIAELLRNGDASAIYGTPKASMFYRDEDSEAQESDEADFYHILKEEYNYLFDGKWLCNKEELNVS